MKAALVAAALAFGSALLAAPAAQAGAWAGSNPCPPSGCAGNGPSLDGLRADNPDAGWTETTGTLRLREVAAPSPAREAEGPGARHVQHPPR